MAEWAVKMCELITFFAQGYCLQYFLGSFLENRRFSRRTNVIAVSGCYGVLKIVLACLLPAGEGSSAGICRLLLQCLLLPVLTFFFYKADRVLTVFLVVTFLALSEISFFIGYMVMNFSTGVLGLETELFIKGYLQADNFERMLLFTAAALQILCFLLWILILFFTLRSVVSAFREKEYDMHRTELLFILTPSLVGFMLCVFLRIIMVTVEDGMPSLLYDRYPVLQFLIPAVLLLSMLSILYSVKLFQDMIALSREKGSRMVLEQQVDMLQEHIREIERIYGNLKSVKHEMKNTITVLMRLFGTNVSSVEAEEENQEAAAYLSALYNSFEKLELHFSTGNAVADALLNMKYHDMNRRIPGGGTGEEGGECNSGCGLISGRMEFSADKLLFPENFAIQSYDIGVILGNALDNAIEACVRLAKRRPEAKPFIRCSSFQRGKFFFLEIENSFDGKLKKSRHGEFPETLKAEKHTHGIGFSNMKKTAEKYGGGVDFSAREDADRPGQAVFTLTVMLIMM